MDAAGGKSNPSLKQKLFDKPYRFDFFQAVRLLERLLPKRVPVGRVSEGRPVPPSREIARFRTHPSLKFPASQIFDLTHENNGEEEEEETPPGTPPGMPPSMEVAFMGLTGPLGVLPNAYTELLIERLRQRDRTLYDFLDLFNHRFISFFYRAWEKYRFPVAYERGLGDDAFTFCLFSIIGMGTSGLRDRMSVRDEAMLCYGGLIAQRPHSAGALSAIVSDYFSVASRVVQFAGQWLPLDGDSISRLGEKGKSELGVSTVAGARVWDSQSKFRLVLGPMSYKQFSDFLPVGTAFKPIMDIVRFLVGAELDFDVQLMLKAEEVPGTVLTTRARRRPMLGWNSWLKVKPSEEDDGQVVLAAPMA
jgi:type VI secretion system protein ImpH